MRQTLFGPRFWVVALLAAALSALAGATVRAGVAALPADWLQTALGPVERTLAAGVRAGQSAGADLAGLWQLRQENAALRAEVASLRLQVLQDSQLQAENRALRLLLHLQSSGLQRFGVQGLTAEVMGRSPDTWFDSLVVDKGSLDGVTPGMVAITPDGLVGRVVQPVGLHSATVMLVTNPEFGVGGMVQGAGAGAEGAAVGQLGSPALLMTFFSPEARVQAGDTIVTSGIDGVFPRGLPVGTVVAVRRDGLVRQAVVRPVAGIDSVQAVLLLPPVGGGG